MNCTIRPLPPRGNRRRWAAGPSYLCSIAVSMVLIVVVAGALSAMGTLNSARGDDEGFNSFYLISGSGHQQGPFVGAVDGNALVGAQRFYDAGFTGTGAVIANIEAGYIWNGHETLTHVTQIPTTPGAAGEFDRHATWSAMVMGGRPGGANPGPYQRGIAPDAQLVSGAIATSWPSSLTRFTGSFSFNFSAISTLGPYRSAFITGVPTSTGLRTADVISTGYNGNGDLAGSNSLSGTLDALMNQNPRTLLVVAPGNNTSPNGIGPNKVLFPATAYNNISVAALASNVGAYDRPSFFSNSGPNDYFDPVNGTVTAIRQVIDIAAPGESFSTAYYGGETGGNGPNLMGPPNGPAGGPDWYTRSISGTSFSTPTVAGGAALLYDAAHALLADKPDARDSRVVKSVLQNSADKTVGWDNGQTAHPNGNGGVFTTRGVDDRVGAGRMNLDRAFDQFLGGTTDLVGTSHGMLGTVLPTGWDFGEVLEGTTNDYLINGSLTAGTTLTATLNWFRDRATLGTTDYVDHSFDNLDLEIWSALGGSPQNLVSESASTYNNTEHVAFQVPTTGQYMLRVRWAGEVFDTIGDVNAEIYGLAWSAVAVPEPASVVLLVAAMLILPHRRRSGLPAGRHGEFTSG